MESSNTLQQLIGQFTNQQDSDMIYVYDQKDQDIVNLMTQSAESFESACNAVISKNKLNIQQIDEIPVKSDNGADTLIQNETYKSGSHQGEIVTQSETVDYRFVYYMLTSYGIDQQQWFNSTANSIKGRNLSIQLINFLLKCNSLLKNNFKSIKIGKDTKYMKTITEWLYESKYSIMNGQSRFINCIKKYQLGISYKANKDYYYEHYPTLTKLLIISKQQDTQFTNAILIICDFIQLLISFFHSAVTDNITFKLQTSTILTINVTDIFDFTIIEQLYKHINNIITDLDQQNDKIILQHIYAIAAIVRIDNLIDIDIKNLSNKYEYNDEMIDCRQIIKSYPYIIRPRDKNTHKLIVDQFEIENYQDDIEEEYYTFITIKQEEKRTVSLNIQEVQFTNKQVLDMKQDKNRLTELMNYIQQSEECKYVQKALQVNDNGQWLQNKAIGNSRKYIKEQLDEIDKRNEIRLPEQFKREIDHYNIQLKLRSSPESYRIFELKSINVSIQRPDIQQLEEYVKELIGMMQIDENGYSECQDHHKIYCTNCSFSRIKFII